MTEASNPMRVEKEVGPAPRLALSRIGGSLRLIGGEGTRLEAHSEDGGGVLLRQAGETWEVEAGSDCAVFVPHQARVEIGTIGGEARLRGLAADLLIRSVGGDLHLRRVGSTAVETVGGDLIASRVDGDLTADQVGGDATLNRVAGKVHLRAVGGDLHLHGASGAVASAAGDLSAEVCPGKGWKGSLVAGGDLAFRLCREASALISYRAGDRASLPTGASPSPKQGEVRLGEGEAEIELRAGANLMVSLMAREEMETGTDIEDKIFGHVDEALHRVEFLAGRAGRVVVDGEAIGRKISRAIEGALERASASARRERGHGVWEAGSRGATSQEERLAILRMLEKGTITVDEAEKLLQALEGEA
ncbi:MAG TPA: hypothetical protein VGA32_07655 [Anaerolineales bacterium]